MPRSAARSPILEHTHGKLLRSNGPCASEFDVRVAIAMRYWHPLTEAAIAEMEKHAPEELVLLPLYPQYSKTTTGSSLNEWSRRFRARGPWRPSVHAMEEFHQDPAYIDAMVELVDGPSRGFADPAGGGFRLQRAQRPGRRDREGDPYQRQIEHTTELVWRRGGWSGTPSSLLPEQGRRVEMAHALDAPDYQEPRRGGREERAGDPDFVRVGPRGDTARDRHRASGAGAVARASPTIAWSPA